MSATAYFTRNYPFQKPAYVDNIVAEVRRLSERDKQISVKIDFSAQTVVSFMAQWKDTNIRNRERRIYVQTKLDDNEEIVLIYMQKIFDEDAVVVNYPQEQQYDAAKELLHFLYTGNLPK